MQNLFPVHHSPHVCNEKNKTCYFHMQLTWLDWSRSRSWSHNRFLVSVSISVSHSLVSVLALVSLCSGLINKPALDYLFKLLVRLFSVPFFVFFSVFISIIVITALFMAKLACTGTQRHWPIRPTNARWRNSPVESITNSENLLITSRRLSSNARK